MDSDSGKEMPKPKKLKTLAFHVEYTKGNNQLHQFVLDNSDSNNSGTEYYINAVLKSMSKVPINDLNADGYSPLHLAVLKNNLLMVKKLLFCLADIDVNVACKVPPKNTALHLATELGHLSIIQELIKEKNNVRSNKRVDVNIQNQNGDTALHLLAKVPHLDNVKIAEYLVWNNANVNTENNDNKSPLHSACQLGSFEIVQFLVNNNADINAKDTYYNRAPLHYAVISKKFEIVQFLVSKNADIDAKDGYDTTPLHFAACEGSLDIIKFLVKHNADVNAKDGYLTTPLHYATSHSKSLQNVMFLVNNHADVNSKDDSDITPLHYAAERGSLEIVQFLVKNDADVNAKDENKITPLHYAVSGLKSFEIVQFLVNNNADVNCKDDCDKTPLNYATSSASFEIVQFLTENDPHVKAKN